MEWIFMRNTQGEGHVPNSPANSLPTSVTAPKIPLSADAAKCIQVTDVQQILGV
jgi:hypothetical protein